MRFVRGSTISLFLTLARIAGAPGRCDRMLCGLARCRSPWTKSTGRCARADLFVAIGTSGAVYPAAGLVAKARGHGTPTCEINLEAADNAELFDEQRLGPASETVPAWVEELVEG